MPEDTEVELAIERERHESHLFTFVPTRPFQSTFNRLYTMLSMLEVNEGCKAQLSTRKLSLPPTNFHDKLWHGTTLRAVNDIWLDNGRMLETEGKGKKRWCVGFAGSEHSQLLWIYIYIQYGALER